jgi:hypothetical protein
MNKIISFIRYPHDYAKCGIIGGCVGMATGIYKAQYCNNSTDMLNTVVLYQLAGCCIGATYKVAIPLVTIIYLYNKLK